MVDAVQDRLDISDLMTGWIHRDLGEWDQLRALFTADAHIEITWFSGAATDFVAGSERMGASALRTKHVVTNPVVQFSADGARAVSETNVIVVAESAARRIGSQTHARFVDRLLRTATGWKIADRRAVYDFSSFTFQYGLADMTDVDVTQYPVEYGSLAYLLADSGFPVAGPYPTRGSDAERSIKANAFTWLRS